MTGRGASLRPIPDFPRLAIAVAVPPERLATAEVFRVLDGRRTLTPAVEGDTHPCPLVWGGPGTDIGRWLEDVSNDLAPVVFDLCPRSRELRDALLETGAAVAGVTGAGSAVFGVFDALDAAREAAGTIAGAVPGVIADAFETGT
jgi:4-diphosphocytidyl-2C-methyl-D-erythritol kinase